MGSRIHYSALVTKIRAMQSRLLKEEDFRILASMENVPQAAAYLRQIPSYQAAMIDLEDAQIHWEDVERLMVGTLYYDFSKIYRFCNGKQRQVLKLYFAKYEIAVIKRALRRIFNHGDRTGEARGLRATLQKYTKVHLAEMAQAETISQFLEALRDTDYQNVLARLEHSEHASLFDYEMTLDLFYFSRIWKEKDRFLRGKELGMMTATLGSGIDMLNMMWIYRARKYYQMPAASIYTLVIPITYRLKDEEIREMVMAESLGKLEALLHRTWYGKRALDFDCGELEKLYRQILRKVYWTERQKDPYSMATVTAYLYDKEQEIDMLTSVLEGVRYGLSSQEILSYVG